MEPLGSRSPARFLVPRHSPDDAFACSHLRTYYRVPADANTIPEEKPTQLGEIFSRSKNKAMAVSTRLYDRPHSGFPTAARRHEPRPPLSTATKRHRCH